MNIITPFKLAALSVAFISAAISAADFDGGFGLAECAATSVTAADFSWSRTYKLEGDFQINRTPEKISFCGKELFVSWIKTGAMMVGIETTQEEFERIIRADDFIQNILSQIGHNPH